MYKVSVKNYKEDKYYLKVVRAVEELLRVGTQFDTIDVLQKIGNLTPASIDSWKRGNEPYLEKVFQGSLSKANRILSIVGFHAHDVNLGKRQILYKHNGNILQFTKSGYKRGEEVYSRQFYLVGKKYS